MWYEWLGFIGFGILIVGCVINIIIDWIKGKAGPFGPNGAEWWCYGIFNLIFLAVMIWMGIRLFK